MILHSTMKTIEISSLKGIFRLIKLIESSPNNNSSSNYDNKNIRNMAKGNFKKLARVRLD